MIIMFYYNNNYEHMREQVKIVYGNEEFYEKREGNGFV